MTPVEKAQELVNKMFNCDKFTPEESMAMLYPHAIQCAIIGVIEIQDVIRYSNHDMEVFWMEVKHELQYMYNKQLPK